MTHAAMDRDKRPVVRRPEVLRKLNAENLYMIERGLLGDLPEKLKPQPFIPRGRPTNLEIAKPSGLLSACLPVVPDSPGSGKLTPSSDEDGFSPLKKSFSFRDKFSRINIFGKDKVKGKIVEEDEKPHRPTDLKRESKAEYDYKSQKRFWFFRNKELTDKHKTHSPIYQRSKSFEFLPRAIEEEEEITSKSKRQLNSSQSCLFESDSMGDAWTSNDSLEYVSNVYYDNDGGVFLKSIKEFPSESSGANSSMSTVTSASSANAANIFTRNSVQDLIEEFNKAVDMFSETYLSDCEPYTRSNKESLVQEHRKSSSFSTIPTPKVLQVNKVSEISEEFKQELSMAVGVKRAPGLTRPRRGSVTDWFVLEDQAGGEVRPSVSEMNKYRRGQKKPINRVRRMSSTKYWITPEECSEYAREQRPPLVIPRITQYRAMRVPPSNHRPYPEDTPTSSMRQYDRLGNWSPSSERSRLDIERSFSKASSDSPPFGRINKRLGGSTENLLVASRRPHQLQIPASSSGDSLDVEIRDQRDVNHARSRKSRSMISAKHRIRSPMPAPRNVPAVIEPSVILEGPVKRTKYLENNKKCKKNWLDFYMILTPTKLVFYKDQKSYLASRGQKTSGAPPSPTSAWPERVLPLIDAKVLNCIPTHTRRYNRSFLLIVKYDQYLIQCDTEEGKLDWQNTIDNIICKLLSSKVSDSPTSQYQSSTTDLESLGRTPPARHRTKPKGSSNEDLSDSTEVSAQKIHVRTRLKKFFARRPAMEVLVKKGIYKDEPVFGRNLEEVCPQTSPRVPEFLVACVKEIESSPENMCTDGLYRASGNLSQVQKVRLEIDQNHLNVIQNNSDVHVLTGSLKLFLRELKEPLIPCSMFDRILAACSIKPREAKIKEFRDIINSLPQCNRDTLKYLLEHLLRVTSYSEQNRMHTANLAIVFGPTILWAPAEQAHNIAVDCIQQNNVVDILLNEFKEIFVEDNKGKKKA